MAASFILNQASVDWTNLNPGCPLSGRYRVVNGQHMLNASSLHFDPVRTLDPNYTVRSPRQDHNRLKGRVRKRQAKDRYLQPISGSRCYNQYKLSKFRNYS